jgi:hypothetical protein
VPIRCWCALLLSFPLACFGQIGPSQSSHAVPRLISADLPRYPPIAEAAHLTGRVTIRVTVENGKVVKTEVINAEVRSGAQILLPQSGWHWLTGQTEENLKSWRFDPSTKDAFVVSYIYEISGTETDIPTNPKVEILPSLDVTITARPVKPTVNY